MDITTTHTPCKLRNIIQTCDIFQESIDDEDNAMKVIQCLFDEFMKHIANLPTTQEKKESFRSLLLNLYPKVSNEMIQKIHSKMDELCVKQENENNNSANNNSDTGDNQVIDFTWHNANNSATKPCTQEEKQNNNIGTKSIIKETDDSVAALDDNPKNNVDGMKLVEKIRFHLHYYQMHSTMAQRCQKQASSEEKTQYCKQMELVNEHKTKIIELRAILRKHWPQLFKPMSTIYDYQCEKDQLNSSLVQFENSYINRKQCMSSSCQSCTNWIDIIGGSQIFSHIGKFLTRLEIIHLGYVNKSWYFETTSAQFIIQSQTINHNPLIINDKVLDSINSRVPSSAIHQCPKAIMIDLRLRKIEQYHQWFNTINWKPLFENVQYLHVVSYNNDLLQYVPIEKIMQPKITPLILEMNFDNDQYQNHIQHQFTQAINGFITQYQQCYQKYGLETRTISELRLNYVIESESEQMVYSLFEALKCNFHRLMLRNCRFNIDTKAQMNNIFHSKLKQLIIEEDCNFMINSKMIATAECIRLHRLKILHVDDNSHNQYYLMQNLCKIGVLNHLHGIDVTLTLTCGQPNSNNTPLLATQIVNNMHHLSRRHASENAWLTAILDTQMKNDIYVKKLKYVNVHVNIGHVYQLQKLVDEIYALSNIKQLISTIKHIRFMINWRIIDKIFCYPTELRNPSRTTSRIRKMIDSVYGWTEKTPLQYPTSTECIEVKLNKKTITQVCHWICKCDIVLNGEVPATKKIVFVCK